MKKTTFKKILILFFLCSLITTAFLVCEFSMRGHLELVKKFNKLAKRKIISCLLSRKVEPLLWKIPYWEYKTNIELKKKINNLECNIKFNNYGLRAKDIQIPKPKGEYRIFCIGGSTTYMGLRNDLSYPNLLEKKLKDYFKSDRIKVYNCGISGLNSSGEKKKLDLLIALQPDLIIEYNFINDLFLVLGKEKKNKLKANLMARSLFLDSFLFKITNEEVRYFLESYTMPNLKSIAKKAKSSNVDIIFCSFVAPVFNNLTTSGKDFFDFDIKVLWELPFINFKDYCNYVKMYNEYLREMCLEKNILFISIAEHFNPNEKDFLDICHLTNQGREKQVDIIFYYLKGYLSKIRTENS